MHAPEVIYVIHTEWACDIMLRIELIHFISFQSGHEAPVKIKGHEPIKSYLESNVEKYSQNSVSLKYIMAG